VGRERDEGLVFEGLSRYLPRKAAGCAWAPPGPSAACRSRQVLAQRFAQGPAGAKGRAPRPMQYATAGRESVRQAAPSARRPRTAARGLPLRAVAQRQRHELGNSCLNTRIRPGALRASPALAWMIRDRCASLPSGRSQFAVQLAIRGGVQSLL